MSTSLTVSRVPVSRDDGPKSFGIGEHLVVLSLTHTSERGHLNWYPKERVPLGVPRFHTSLHKTYGFQSVSK